MGGGVWVFGGDGDVGNPGWGREGCGVKGVGKAIYKTEGQVATALRHHSFVLLSINE